ncbi:unnamed protein product [Pedinophyceae sp. YPF-701]|nr:unnamed protein product [Pedinophyceae sp. YPF-701]
MSTCARRCAVIVEATGKASVEKTYRVSLRNRARNKARKSAIATRMKKVFTALESSKESAKTEADIKDVEVLISEAFSEIDKAVVKGALHKSTAARRKARLSAAKNKFLAAAGAA